VKHSARQTHLVIVLVTIQLVVIPATQMLHTECHHAANVMSLASTEACSSPYRSHASEQSSCLSAFVELVWNACQGPCCDRQHTASVDVEWASSKVSPSDSPMATPDEPNPDQPAHGHDTDDCSICRTVFAARTTAEAVRVICRITHRISCTPVAETHVRPPAKSCVPNRGPPVIS
jgi:hypothetical protein